MYEVVVVGAGPAGATAARNCVKQGLRTLLIEKDSFPRIKPCGGALSEQAMSLLDFEIPIELMEKDCFGARVHYGKFTVEVKKEYRIAVLTSRDKFDKFLLQQALESGVEICQPEIVEKLYLKDSYVLVKTNLSEYKAQIVVGADGVNSLISKYVRKKPLSLEEFGICLVTNIPATNEIIDKYIHNAIDIHFGVADMGYGWVFPHDNYFSVGIGGIASQLKKPKQVFNDFLRTNGFETPNKVYAHKIPAGGIKRKNVADRILLVGDAAGFVDTFYGEGIAYAIHSGLIAARIIINGLKERNLSQQYLKLYEAECSKFFAENLKWSLILTKTMHKFPELFIRVFASNRAVLDKYLEVPATKLAYREYLNWLLLRVPYFLLKSFLHSDYY